MRKILILLIVLFCMTRGALACDKEYNTARYVWDYCQEEGLTEQATAAILGNMMVETSGGTLDINPTSETRSFYGLCHWNKKLYPQVRGENLSAQCDFLFDTMPQEFKIFGKNYEKGFSYEDFAEMENTRQAALAFAKVYERCSSGSYSWRQDCAEEAYEYFMSEIGPEASALPVLEIEKAIK